MNFKETKVHSSRCYHVNLQGQKLYSDSFDVVLPFHAPGLAPVSKGSDAWHIDTMGNPAYLGKFLKTFGFYCNVAAVEDGSGKYHIQTDGSPLYNERYSFVGNYQHNVCVVCNDKGEYFHIDLEGKALYAQRWSYCGDFREGFAVGQSKNGMHTHFDSSGVLLHKKWFNDLDVYHKGFARACDESGWFHIDELGEAIYSTRYKNIEPFYNGKARVESHDGSLLVINESGGVERTLREKTRCDFAELSADMVGYWKTKTIATAVKLELFEYLPNKTSHLAKMINTDETRLLRLLKALGELRLVKLNGKIWEATDKGSPLSKSHDKSLASAALEYDGDLSERWDSLPEYILGKEVKQDIFQNVSDEEERSLNHHKMLSSYALNDYPKLIKSLGVTEGDIVFDAGGGTGLLASLIKQEYPQAQVISGDLAGVESIYPGSIEFNLFQKWPIKATKIILARVLHDWNNEQVKKILSFAKEALLEDGEIYILEMLLDEQSFSGALCDIHLLTVTGGQERSYREFENLMNESGFRLEQIPNQGLVSVLKGIQDDE